MVHNVYLFISEFPKNYAGEMKQIKLSFKSVVKKKHGDTSLSESDIPQPLPEDEEQAHLIDNIHPSEDQELAVNQHSGDSYDIGTLEDIKTNYERWRLRTPENLSSLHKRTQRCWLTSYNPKWKKDWSWAEAVSQLSVFSVRYVVHLLLMLTLSSEV